METNLFIYNENLIHIEKLQRLCGEILLFIVEKDFVKKKSTFFSSKKSIIKISFNIYEKGILYIINTHNILTNFCYIIFKYF